MTDTNRNFEFLRTTPKLFFVAMEAELDASLLKTPVIYTGVGKARATRALIRYIKDNQELVASGEAPLIVSIGTAASGKYSKGDIVMVDNFYNNGDSFIQEKISFDTFPEATGHVCASSDFFVGPENFEAGKIEAMRSRFDCMDMESFALANVCREYGLRFCAVKCISDGGDGAVCDFDAELPRFREILNNFAKSID